MVLESLFQSLVALVCSQSLVRQRNLAFAVIYFYYFCFHLIANLNLGSEIYVCFVGVLTSRDDTIGLVSNVQDDLVLFHIDDFTSDDLSRTYCF